MNLPKAGSYGIGKRQKIDHSKTCDMLDIIIQENLDKSDRDLLHKVLLEFHLLNIKLDKLMTKAEFIQGITDLKTEVTGIGTKVDALEAAINSAGDVIPQEVVDAFADLKGSVDSLNSKADNTPVTPPAEPAA